jgi:hypothetical protein
MSAVEQEEDTDDRRPGQRRVGQYADPEKAPDRGEPVADDGPWGDDEPHGEWPPVSAVAGHFDWVPPSVQPEAPKPAGPFAALKYKRAEKPPAERKADAAQLAATTATRKPCAYCKAPKDRVTGFGTVRNACTGVMVEAKVCKECREKSNARKYGGDGKI